MNNCVLATVVLFVNAVLAIHKFYVFVKKIHRRLHRDASSVMFSQVIRCFRSSNSRNPHSCDSAGVEQMPVCIPAAFNVGLAILI